MVNVIACILFVLFIILVVVALFAWAFAPIAKKPEPTSTDHRMEI